jgi:hypothetical protein
MKRETRDSIDRIVAYCWEDEAEDFEVQQAEDDGFDPETHVFTHLQRVQAWLVGEEEGINQQTEKD